MRTTAIQMSPQNVCVLTVILFFAIFASYAAAVLPNDNFTDNVRGAMWGRFGIVHLPLGAWSWFSANGGPGHVTLNETNQRLELISTYSIDGETAIYGSLGWGLMTTEDFRMRVNFYHYGTSGIFSNVSIGIISDFNFLLVPERFNYVIVSAAHDGIEAMDLFYYEQAGSDTPYDRDIKSRSSRSGTLYISYDAYSDELYLSDTGYGSANAWKTIPDLVQGAWERNIVGVCIGGFAQGADLTTGQAYLDNFIVDLGTVCTGPLDGDFNEDCKVDFKDFATFAGNWLNDNLE